MMSTIVQVYIMDFEFKKLNWKYRLKNNIKLFKKLRLSFFIKIIFLIHKKKYLKICYNERDNFILFLQKTTIKNKVNLHAFFIIIFLWTLKKKKKANHISLLLSNFLLIKNCTWSLKIYEFGHTKFSILNEVRSVIANQIAKIMLKHIWYSWIWIFIFFCL